MLKSDKEWEKFGKNDPYYGVVSLDKFHKGKLDAAAKDEFFKSGQVHLEFIYDAVKKYIHPDFNPSRTMDFGCGVGRCLIPLAGMSEHAVGIDVSSSMLEEGQKNCDERNITNTTLTSSDDELSGVEGSFDFIHSFIVFQHIHPSRGYVLFKSMIDKLNDGGVGALQFIYNRHTSKPLQLLGKLRKKVPLFHNIVNLFTGKPFSEPLMEKNVYDVNTLFDILHQNNCPRVHVLFEGKGKIRSLVLLFQKDTSADVYDYEAFFDQSGN